VSINRRYACISCSVKIRHVLRAKRSALKIFMQSQILATRLLEPEFVFLTLSGWHSLS
jgi:hypothetical protein